MRDGCICRGAKEADPVGELTFIEGCADGFICAGGELFTAFGRLTFCAGTPPVFTAGIFGDGLCAALGVAVFLPKFKFVNAPLCGARFFTPFAPLPNFGLPETGL